MLANHPGGFFSVCEWYPSVSCQCQWEIYRAVTSCQPAFVRPFAAATQHILSLLKANKESWRRFCWAGWKGEKRCQDHSWRTALTHQKILTSLSKSYFFLNINDNKRQMESWGRCTAICSAFLRFKASLTLPLVPLEPVIINMVGCGWWCIPKSPMVFPEWNERRHKQPFLQGKKISIYHFQVIHTHTHIHTR